MDARRPRLCRIISLFCLRECWRLRTEPRCRQRDAHCHADPCPCRCPSHRGLLSPSDPPGRLVGAVRPSHHAWCRTPHGFPSERPLEAATGTFNVSVSLKVRAEKRRDHSDPLGVGQEQKMQPLPRILSLSWSVRNCKYSSNPFVVTRFIASSQRTRRNTQTNAYAEPCQTLSPGLLCTFASCSLRLP